jgi:hypothetical protein
MMFGACYALNSMAQNASTSEFGKNIITVSPIQLVESGLFYNNDVCINLAYERIFGNEYFGVKLPGSISLKNQFFYFMPTLKLYPAKQGLVRYAVGPQLFFGTGKIKYAYYNYNNYPYPETILSERRTEFGFMINNSVNFTIIKDMYLGMDLGMGLNYYNNWKDNDDYANKGNDSPFDPIVQFNFSMGYRF